MAQVTRETSCSWSKSEHEFCCEGVGKRGDMVGTAGLEIFDGPARAWMVFRFLKLRGTRSVEVEAMLNRESEEL